MNVFLLLLLPIFAADAQVRKIPPRNACFRNACFFVVDGATKDANTYDKDKHVYKFDIRLARNICYKSNNATLAIIRNREETELLAGKDFCNVDGFDVQRIAMGLNQEGGKYQWDDGTPLLYEEKAWLDKEKTGDYTRLWFPTPCKNGKRDDKRVWENVLPDGRTPEPVAVVCKTRGDVVQLTECDKKPRIKSANESEMEAKRFGSESCFFVPKDDVGEYHRLVGDKYFFNFTNAKAVCARYNKATLPIITSDAENNFLAKAFEPKQDRRFDIPIGLHQKRTKEKREILYFYYWTDNSYFSYEAFWPDKFEPASYTYISDSTGTWSQDDPFGTAAVNGTELPVQIVCEQRYPDQDVPTTPAYENKCQGNTTTNRVTYDNKFCYFTVPKATSLTNKKAGDGTYEFNVWKAREICQRESATLLTINSQDESNLIRKHYSSEHFENVSAIGIALDVRQPRTPSQYVNIDKSHVHLPSTIDNDKTYAVYTLMMFDKDAWMNAVNKSNQRQVAVLCKQKILTVVATTAKVPPPKDSTPRPTDSTTGDEAGKRETPGSGQSGKLRINSLILIFALIVAVLSRM